jgi:nitroreductase
VDFFDVIEKRQAIRLFTDTPIEREKLDAILDAAVNRAPSAGNMQSYRVYVVERDEDRRALRQVARDREYITSARVVLVFCTDPAAATERYGERGERYAIQDAAIACTYAMLAETAQGLASVPVGSFDDQGAWRIIGSPEGVAPMLMLPIGYAAEVPERRERRPMSDVVYHMGK